MASQQFVRRIATILSSTFADLHTICQHTPSLDSLQDKSKEMYKDLSEPCEIISVEEAQVESKEEKRKRRRKKNIAGKPKPPANAFVLYLQEKKNQIQTQHEGITIATVTSIASKHWKEMGQKQKEPFVQKYEQNKEKYEKEKVQFYKEHPEYDPENKAKNQTKKTKVDEPYSITRREKMKEKKKANEQAKKEVEDMKEGEQEEANDSGEKI